MDNVDQNPLEPDNPPHFSDPDEGLDDQILMTRFKEYVLQKEGAADSVYQFAKYLNIEEAAFYDHFSSLRAIKRQIWKQYFDETLARLKSDEVYLNYTVREKLLAFFYTFFELLKGDRSFVVKTTGLTLRSTLSNEYLDDFKTQYFNYINEIIDEGKESGEVADRFLISKQYAQGLWLQFLFVLNFWVKDESKGFEKTDAAIEKAINLSADLMGRSALDSFTDFAKFVYQSR